jgi:hypothetical protein
MFHLTEILKPQFDPRLHLSQSRLNLSESDRRVEEGLHILHGLSENQRIMVQGPPNFRMPYPKIRQAKSG